MEPVSDPTPTPTAVPADDRAMENELLRYENAHLRARLAAAAGTTGGVNRADQSRDDLVWLLGRLDGSLAAPVLRRSHRYRQLVETYLRASQR